MPKTDALTVKTTLVADDEFIINDSEVVDPTTTVATKVVDRNNAYIYMKGYQKYALAIRQSGTDAPTISVIKDDFGIDVLTFTRILGGMYTTFIDENISTTLGAVNIYISNPNIGIDTTHTTTVEAYITKPSTKLLLTIMTKYDGTLCDSRLTDGAGVIISIIKPI